MWFGSLFALAATLEIGGSGGAIEPIITLNDPATHSNIIARIDTSGASAPVLSLKVAATMGGTPAEHFRIDGATGRVGIGTSSPASVLHVSTSDAVAQIKLESTRATQGQPQITLAGTSPSGAARHGELKYDNGDVLRLATTSAIPLEFHTSDAVRMRILADGKVGIGTISPTSALDVSGTVTATSFTSGLGATVAGQSSHAVAIRAYKKTVTAADRTNGYLSITTTIHRNSYLGAHAAIQRAGTGTITTNNMQYPSSNSPSAGSDMAPITHMIMTTNSIIVYLTATHTNVGDHVAVVVYAVS